MAGRGTLATDHGRKLAKQAARDLRRCFAVELEQDMFGHRDKVRSERKLSAAHMLANAAAEKLERWASSSDHVVDLTLDTTESDLAAVEAAFRAMKPVSFGGISTASGAMGKWEAVYKRTMLWLRSPRETVETGIRKWALRECTRRISDMIERGDYDSAVTGVHVLTAPRHT